MPNPCLAEHAKLPIKKRILIYKSALPKIFNLFNCKNAYSFKTHATAKICSSLNHKMAHVENL